MFQGEMKGDCCLTTSKYELSHNLGSLNIFGMARFECLADNVSLILQRVSSGLKTLNLKMFVENQEVNRSTNITRGCERFQKHNLSNLFTRIYIFCESWFQRNPRNTLFGGRLADFFLADNECCSTPDACFCVFCSRNNMF